jgi:repressor of nif and glnA expression
MSVSEETVSKVFLMLPDCPTVEQLMETGQFYSSNTIRAALRILEERGHVNAEELFGRSVQE